MIYNPLSKDYKSILGAVPSNKNIKFRVKGDFGSVIFVVKKDGEDICYYPMQKNGDFFEVQLKFSVGLYFYYFICDNKFISLSDYYIGEISTNINCFQLSVYDKNYSVPKFLRGGIIYQIFPDRFYSSSDTKEVGDGKILHQNKDELPVFLPNAHGEVLNNDFFGGDIRGIVDKLDYLKELSVSAIYLNPIFEAYSNHRYDTANYFKIDPLLGTEEDLIELVSEADKRGIKIILDGVFNHTGSDSVYFNKDGRYGEVGAYQSQKSPYVDWFQFINHPEKYNSWWGIKTLPAVNKKKDSPFIDFICGEKGVLEHYTKLGIAGWRLDVVDELPAHFVERIRKSVKSINENAIIIGEVWEDASNKISYGKRRKYFCGDELDSVMNYPLKNAIISFVLNKDAKKLSYVIKEQTDHYPKDVRLSLMNILSTHDTFRLLSALAPIDVNGLTKSQMARISLTKEEYSKAVFNLKVATLLQFALPGVPSIYYGDEIGMTGYGDPLNRCYFSWDNIDNDILNWYKKLAKIRKNFSAFSEGDYEEICADEGVFVYKITCSDNEVLIAVNISNEDVYISFNGKLYEHVKEITINDGYNLASNSFAVLTNS